MMRRALVRGLFLVAVVACAKRDPIATSGRLDPVLAREVRAVGVGILPVVRMQDLPAPPLPALSETGGVEARLRGGEEHLAVPTVLDPESPRDAAFLRNEYIGNIRFGGGFIRTGDVALEVRARTIELGAERAYVEQGTRWLADALPRVLAAVRVPVNAPVARNVPAPDRRRSRGLHPEDGHDNLNLPRTELVPQPLAQPAPQSAGGAAGAALASGRWVVVPWLRAYYTHNGGWFLGQTFGCTAGARVEVEVAIYDSVSGQPVWWMAATGRHIQSMTSQPSTAEMDQYLLWAEQQAEEHLIRGWLR